MLLITKDRSWEPTMFMKIQDLAGVGHDVYENKWLILIERRSGRGEIEGRLSPGASSAFARQAGFFQQEPGDAVIRPPTAHSG